MVLHTSRECSFNTGIKQQAARQAASIQEHADWAGRVYGRAAHWHSILPVVSTGDWQKLSARQQPEGV